MRLKFLVPLVVLALTAALAVVSDAPAGGIADEPCPNVAGEHTNTCPPGTVGVAYSIKFREAEGSGCGPGKQKFALDSGTFPPGLGLSSDGTVSGTPTQAGNFTFYIKMSETYEAGVCAGEVTDKRFTIPVNPGQSAPPAQPPVSPPAAVPQPKLVIGPDQSAVPPATVDALFSLAMTANLPDAKTWSIVAGALPAGLTLGSGNGVISGAPTAAGVFAFTVKAEIDAQRTATNALAITVRQPLVIAAPENHLTAAGGLPPAEVEVAFSAAFTASGGFGAYTWSIAAGALPPGLALGSDGTVAGRPTTAGRYGFTVSVLDAEGRTQRHSAVLRVAQRLAIFTRVIRSGKVGRLYSQNLKAVGGVNPKSWRLTKGRLPRGIRLDRVLGVFTGTPAKAGTYRVTVEATDALGVKSAKTFILVVRR